ncbi:helix-turn-helix domain-containing protein [Roseivirga sp.]|uniref:helix-turn-helix domain-containing protein n=1 Tax=Roseivirga sp. TaxID=1964215 RepID=UPI002B265922|nr:helix-turn-helix domain-containing protein [Roseivirga sp.]
MDYVLKKIKELRVSRGLSQDQMAEAIGVNQSNYGKVERGSSQITLNKLFEIAKKLDTPVFMLLYNEDKDEWPFFDKESEVTIEALKKKNELLEKENEQWKEIVELLKKNVELLKQSFEEGELTKRNEQLWEIVNHQKAEYTKLEKEFKELHETKQAIDNQTFKSIILNHKFRKKLIELGFEGVNEIEKEVALTSIKEEDTEPGGVFQRLKTKFGLVDPNER